MLNFISTIARGVHQLVGSEHSKQQGLNWSRIGATVLLSSVLTACGGGGGDTPVFANGNGNSGGSSGGGVSTEGQVKIGNGTSSDFVQNTLGANSTTLDPGATTTIYADIVDENNDPISSAATVTFSSACVTAGKASFGNPSANTVSGRASTTFTDLGCSGAISSLVEAITATVSVNGEDKTASVNITIAADSSIGNGTGTSFVEGVLDASAKDLSAGDQVILTVNIVDYTNAAIDESVNVTFSSNCVSNKRATLSSTNAATVNGQATVTYTDEGCSSATASIEDVVTARVLVNGSPVVATTNLNISANAKIGRGLGAGFEEGVINVSSPNIVAGGNTAVTVNIVGFDNTAIGDPVSVVFSSDCLGSGLASFDQATVETVAGRATTTYRDNGCSGVANSVDDTITATAIIDGVPIEATADVTTAPNTVLAVTYLESTLNQINIKGMGSDETTQLKFRLVGAQGAPIIGETINFSTSSNAGGLALVETTKVTDSNGEVTVGLQSGTVATTVNVIATHADSGIQGVSEGIVISTGVPIANRFSLSLTAFNPANAFDTDGVEVDLTVIASDQFGNNVPDGTRISFWSPESGNIGSFCVISDGDCSVTWRSSSPRPADMRLTVMAYTDGAEEFTDNNGNNIFDSAAEFNSAADDLAEPFTDENEDGAYNVGEFFVDTNEDTSRSLGNGEWDGPCLQESNANAICNGRESLTISATAVIVMPTSTARLLATNFAVNSTIDVSGGVQTLTITLADSNTNAGLVALGSNPMPEGTTLTFSADNGKILGGASHTVMSTTSPTTHSVTIKADDTPGESDFLTLTVTAPDGTESIFFWTVED